MIFFHTSVGNHVNPLVSQGDSNACSPKNSWVEELAEKEGKEVNTSMGREVVCLVT